MLERLVKPLAAEMHCAKKWGMAILPWRSEATCGHCQLCARCNRHCDPVKPLMVDRLSRGALDFISSLLRLRQTFGQRQTLQAQRCATVDWEVECLVL